MGAGTVSEASGHEGAGEGETRRTPQGLKNWACWGSICKKEGRGFFVCSELKPLLCVCETHKKSVLKKRMDGKWRGWQKSGD